MGSGWSSPAESWVHLEARASLAMAGGRQCCVRHSEAFSRVKLARCGGSRHAKLGDIRLLGRQGCPQLFPPCSTSPPPPNQGLCYGPGACDRAADNPQISTWRSRGLYPSPKQHRGRAQLSRKGLQKGGGRLRQAGHWVLISGLGSTLPAESTQVLRASLLCATHKAGVVLCIQERGGRSDVYSK